MNAEALVNLIRNTRSTGDEAYWGTSDFTPYYSFEFNGEFIKGERDIADRLALMNYPDMTGARYLDLGCNLGLFAMTTVKKHGASLAMGVDADAHIVESARHIAADRDISDKTIFVQGNLNDLTQEWVAAQSGYDTFEYMSCFSVFRHIMKGGVLALPQFFVTVGKICTRSFFFENCAEIETEQIIQCLQEVGFERADYLGRTERDRDLVVVHKG